MTQAEAPAEATITTAEALRRVWRIVEQRVQASIDSGELTRNEFNTEDVAKLNYALSEVLHYANRNGKGRTRKPRKAASE